MTNRSPETNILYRIDSISASYAELVSISNSSDKAVMNKMSEERLVIGLTGSFGSGCGEVSEYLIKKGFEKFSLTKRIKEEAEKREIPNPTRRDMQNIGDDLRKEHGNAFLAKEVIKEIGDVLKHKIVVKSIRNNYEVEEFRNTFHNDFILFNIDADRETRYSRCKEKEKYTSRIDFDYEDARDSGEDQPDYGQQVRKCVDSADVVINNLGSIEELQEKVDRYLKLIANPGSERAEPHEINMKMAFDQTRHSLCLKRGIGAVITDNGRVIASGYNGTPEKVASCISLNSCYKDHAKECEVVDCRTPFQAILRVCVKCGRPIEQKRVAQLEKNLDLCRGVHGEERAILQIAIKGGQTLKDTTLYTTTFPCLLCAKQIIEVGISDVWYVEPYPFTEAYKILRDAKVKLHKFEGVKSSTALDRLYPRRT